MNSRTLTFIPLLLFLIFLSSFFISCNTSEYIVDFDSTNDTSKILAVSKNKERIILDEYPLFPGLTRDSILVNRAGAFYENGNVLVMVPNKNTTKNIKAWNDFSYLIDIIFIEPGNKRITTLFSNHDSYVSIVPDAKATHAIIAFDRDKTLTLLRVDQKGKILQEIQYKYRVLYPDFIGVTEETGKEVITLSCIENEEKISIDWKNGIIMQISYMESQYE